MEQEYYNPVLKLYSEGEPISSYCTIIYTSIRNEVDRVGKATIKLYTNDEGENSFLISDGNYFRHGSALKLDIAHNNNDKTLFEGIVISTEIQVNSGQPNVLIVECRDYSFLTTLGRKNSVFENSTDSDILNKIISNYSAISLKAEDTNVKHPTLVQYYCTDWDFILSRADNCGMIVLSSGKQLVVKKPILDADTVAEYTFGTDILDFNGKLSIASQYAEVNTVAWNAAKQEIEEVINKTQTTNNQGDLAMRDLVVQNKNVLRYQTDASVNKESLDSWASALAIKNALSRYSGNFTVRGNPNINAGDMVMLNGFGKRYDGNVFVGSVEHTIEENIWNTKIGMGLSNYKIVEEPDVTAPLASGFLPGIQGLHIGIVKQIHGDPLNGFRILIEYPLINGNKNSIWSRLLTPYPGTGAGVLFIPEVGEEVVVGFFNNDPCNPVVLGGLYNEKHKPPVNFTEKNEIKTITSKGKLTIEFNDDKKIITIKTPGGNQFEMNDDKKSISIGDANENKIVMNSDGITIKTNKNIVMEAKGNITTEATSKLQLSSKSSDVAINGINVKATASASIACKGNATAEISSSGNTVVKGSMVMIN